MRLVYHKFRDVFDVWQSDGFAGDIQVPGLALSPQATAKLREWLCVEQATEQASTTAPLDLTGKIKSLSITFGGLTAEQVEVSALEAEFDAAKADGRLDYWTYIDGMTMHQYQLGISDGKLYGDSTDSRLAAAQAAAAKLRAIKPAPRPVENMTAEECKTELRARNWARFVNDAWLTSAWVSHSRAIWEDVLASPTDSIRSVLTRARELDAEEPNRD